MLACHNTLDWKESATMKHMMMMNARPACLSHFAVLTLITLLAAATSQTQAQTAATTQVSAQVPAQVPTIAKPATEAAAAITNPASQASTAVSPSATASAVTAAPVAPGRNAAAPAATNAAAATVPSSPRSATPLFKNDVYGVEVMGAHVSSAGYVIDVRYKVLDAAKAAPMLDRQVRPVLINEANNERFYVPQPPIVGALRQTSRNQNIVPGKVYFMLFANPDKRIKNGDKLTLMVGDQKFGVLEVGR
jgi:hypothetical protein